MTYNIGELSPLKRAWVFRNSNIPQRFMGLEPEDILRDKGAWPEEIDEWLDNALDGKVVKSIGGLGLTGVGLLFDGGPGLGKTTHAVTAAMELVRRLPDADDELARVLGYKASDIGHMTRPIYYITFPELLARKKAMFDADHSSKQLMGFEMDGFHGRAQDDALNVRVLVIDDLGKEYGSKYDDTSFDEILRSRYDKALPTIVTTNVSRENWGSQYGAAMGSFASEAFERVKIGGKDLRLEQ
jgi:DNA replication protein DnaC